jgi:hypothetical protein
MAKPIMHKLIMAKIQMNEIFIDLQPTMAQLVMVKLIMLN